MIGRSRCCRTTPRIRRATTTRASAAPISSAWLATRPRRPRKCRLHIHFNGAGGNVVGRQVQRRLAENRPILAGRLAEGMKRAWDDQKKVPVGELSFDWATRDVKLPLGEWYDEKEQLATLQRQGQQVDPAAAGGAQHRLGAASDGRAQRSRSAGCGLGPIDILHMPGELFVEYQLAAQKMRPDSFVCMAAYGDYGPGYIGTAIAYTQGGYETGSARRSRACRRGWSRC